MSTNGLYVDTDIMGSEGRSTIASSEEFGVLISNLTSEVDSLISIWRGQAATDFKTSVDGEVNLLREFQGILNLFGEKVTQASRNFEETESANADASRNLYS